MKLEESERIAAHTVHALGLRTARENIADLCDAGSFVEYGALAFAAQRARRTLDDLRAAQETLVRGATLRAVGELAAGAAHHLNNLLAVVLGRAQLLLHRVADPKSRHNFNIDNIGFRYFSSEPGMR